MHSKLKQAQALHPTPINELNNINNSLKYINNENIKDEALKNLSNAAEKNENHLCWRRRRNKTNAPKAPKKKCEKNARAAGAEEKNASFWNGGILIASFWNGAIKI